MEEEPENKRAEEAKEKKEPEPEDISKDPRLRMSAANQQFFSLEGV